MSNRRITMFAALFCLATPIVSALTAQNTLRDNAQAIAVNPTALAAAPAVAATDSLVSALAPVGAVASRAAVEAPAPAGTAFASHSAASAGSQNSHNTGLMIVGGAALLVGALVGGKAGGAIMVGGAVVGLVGLWRYLE